jgi:selenocysteine lyase/cysteine desulfurase
MAFRPDRRQLLAGATLGGAALASATPIRLGPIALADLSSHYDVEAGIHNLEAGYWSMMPRVVEQAFLQHTRAVNRSNSVWGRGVRGDDNWVLGHRSAQQAVAQQVGVLPEEIAITRSGSDALQMLIVNYRALKPGDAVIHCDLDYDSTIGAMTWLSTHRGAKLVRFAMPEPATTANILQAYEDVLTRTPKAKLLLVTQVSNRTGLVTPVREIVAMARARGVDTIVDAAHGVALLDFKLDDLGADFVGWSVHKWTSAPLGTGAMYIRKSRLKDIDPAYESEYVSHDDINSRVPDGTMNFAAVLTIPDAIAFQNAIGIAAKERHMRGLRDTWVRGIADLPNVSLTVPDDPARYCAITSFRLKGMDTVEKAKAVQQRLFDKHRVLTVWRQGIAGGPAIRVTPGLYTTEADLDALVRALRSEQAMFV